MKIFELKLSAKLPHKLSWKMNIKCLGMRILTVSKMLNNINEGYFPFTFGRLYMPNTTEEKADRLTTEMKIEL